MRVAIPIYAAAACGYADYFEGLDGSHHSVIAGLVSLILDIFVLGTRI